MGDHLGHLDAATGAARFEEQCHLRLACRQGAGQQPQFPSLDGREDLGVVVQQRRPQPDRVVERLPTSGQLSSTARIRAAPTTHTGYIHPSDSTDHTRAVDAVVSQ